MYQWVVGDNMFVDEVLLKVDGVGEKGQELRQMKVTITAQDVDNSEGEKGINTTRVKTYTELLAW